MSRFKSIAFLFCLFAGTLSYAQPSLDYSLDFELSPKNCKALPQPRPLIREYVKTWQNPLQEDIPVLDEEQEENARRLVRFQQVKSCLMDYSFSNVGTYMSTVQLIGPLIYNNGKADHKIQALFSLILDLNERWQSVMVTRRLMQEENESTDFMIKASAVAGIVIASHLVTGNLNTTNISKSFRLFRQLWTRPSMARLAHGLIGIGTRPGFINAGYLTVGATSGKVAKKLHNEDLNQTIAYKVKTSQFKKITGDFEKQVWPSPIMIIDLAGDHRDNDVTRYETYSFYRNMGSIATGTIAGIYLHKGLRGFLEKRFPITSYLSNLVRQSEVAATVTMGRTTLAVAATEFAVGVAIGVTLFKISEITSKLITDVAWQKRIGSNLYKNQRRLIDIKGDYWEEKLGSKIIGSNGLFNPVLKYYDPNKDYQTIISEAILSAAYKYKYTVEQNADFYRGKAQLKQKELVESFINDFICTGLKYQRYTYDLTDKANGVRLPEGHLLISKERATELYNEGEVEFKEIEDEFKQELGELYSGLKNNKDLKKSLKVYDDAIDTLEVAMHHSGRYFLNNIITELRAEKSRAIYELNTDVFYKNTMIGVNALYKSVMEDSSVRNDGGCPSGVWQDFKEKYILRNAVAN